MVIPTREPDVFGAISDRARRRMLDLLVAADRSVNAIAGHFPMSRPAVSQHLGILLDAGLVTEQRHGRERRYRLVPQTTWPGAGLDRTLRAVLGRPAPATPESFNETERKMTESMRRELLIPQSQEQVW